MFATKIDPAHYIMINIDLMNKYIDEVIEQAPLIILDSKSALFMDYIYK